MVNAHSNLPINFNHQTKYRTDSIQRTGNSNPSMETILVVEETDDMRYLSPSLCGRYQMLEVSISQTALELATQSMPDLIIIDLIAAGMSGLQLCQQFKSNERTNHIPVVILSAKVDVEDRIKGIAHGADDYICKPYYVEEVEARIENLITTRKKLKEKFSTESRTTEMHQPVQSADEKLLRKINRVVSLHLDDTSFSVNTFAHEVGVSNVQLYRKLTSLTGYSPNDYIRHLRLQRAGYLLHKKFGNVSEVAYTVGFNSLSYFSKCFREKFGCTPCTYILKVAA